jgi:uncharacterized membrane protein YczE
MALHYAAPMKRPLLIGTLLTALCVGLAVASFSLFS